MNYPSETGPGMQSMLFEKTVVPLKTEYAYVYAGTNSFEDGVEDVTQLMGKSPQCERAKNNSITLSAELGEAELTFSGHSLGGELAAVSSMVTGRDAIGFNSAAVSKATMQILNLGSDQNITNYYVPGIQIGPLDIGGDPVTKLQNNLNIKIPGTLIPLPIPVINPLKAHKIDTVIQQLKPKDQ